MEAMRVSKYELPIVEFLEEMSYRVDNFVSKLFEGRKARNDWFYKMSHMIAGAIDYSFDHTNTVNKWLACKIKDPTKRVQLRIRE